MPKPWTQERIDLCLSLYEKGFSQDQVAKQMKASQATVCMYLKRFAVACRFAPWPAERKQKMISLYLSGVSVSQTAQQMGTAKATVRKYLREAKIRIRPHIEATHRGRTTGTGKVGGQ